jgi:hypothetical protein
LCTLRIVKSYVKTADAGEKIDELVGGLLCHGSPKHIHNWLESHKWTPVHHGEIVQPHSRGESASRRLASLPKAS